MNFQGQTFKPRRAAKLRYLDADYQVLSAGEFVACAVSGDPILLEDLRYWSVDAQEAYKSAAEAFAAELRRRQAKAT